MFDLEELKRSLVEFGYPIKKVNELVGAIRDRVSSSDVIQNVGAEASNLMFEFGYIPKKISSGLETFGFDIPNPIESMKKWIIIGIIGLIIIYFITRSK